jgi:hypothetical protein
MRELKPGKEKEIDLQLKRSRNLGKQMVANVEFLVRPINVEACWTFLVALYPCVGLVLVGV